MVYAGPLEHRATITVFERLFCETRGCIQTKYKKIGERNLAGMCAMIY